MSQKRRVFEREFVIKTKTINIEIHLDIGIRFRKWFLIPMLSIGFDIKDSWWESIVATSWFSIILFNTYATVHFCFRRKEPIKYPEKKTLSENVNQIFGKCDAEQKDEIELIKKITKK